MKKQAEMTQNLMALSLPIGMMVVTPFPAFEILFVNEMFIQTLGFNQPDTFLKTYKWSAWNFVYHEDANRLKEAAANRNGQFDPYEISYRVVKEDGNLIWVNQHSRHILDENGRELVMAYYIDITEQKQMGEKAKANEKKYETLINSIPGGVGMYKLNETFTPIFISHRVYELCGMTQEEYCKATEKSTLDVFHPEDRQGLIDAVKEAYEEKRKFEYIHRVLQKDGSYRWMRVSGQVMTVEGETPILYTVFTDVHEQIQAEQALRESEFRYAIAIKSSNINIWEYEYSKDTLLIVSKSPRISGQGSSIENYIYEAINGKHLREDCITVFLDTIEKMKKGAKELTLDIWLRLQVDDDYWCERVTCTNIFDQGGIPVKAYCIGRDVTKEKEAEKRYQEEVSYRKAMQKATMASINVNLTKNTILDHKSNFPEITAHMRVAKTAQDYFNGVCAGLTTEAMQKQFVAVIGRDALLNRFAKGETTVSLELIRRIGGRRYWTVMTAHMMKMPEDNGVVAFLYSIDITNERTMQNVMNAIVKTDYDFLVVVDAPRNFAVRYSENQMEDTYASESNHFEEETQQYVKEYVCAKDSSRVEKEITVENILEQLNTYGTYSIFYDMLDSEGVLLKKQLRFSYINRGLQIFLMTRIDITVAVEEQEKKNRELVAAVKMAENANAAKSEFLSRISHEIRTPMNAIMGLAEVALQNLDDKRFVRDCIEKSQYSSQYLLLLLNDILDMSRIESGKVVLKKERIVCQHFLEGIHTIIGTQAAEKGVSYAVTEFKGRANSYLGDRVRFQQILINILSNAVKFTPSGGMVHLDVSQMEADEKRVRMCFKISDTGIGISQEFLPKLFKPFSQEHCGATTDYGGSGLGLAISKNLAQLMGGDIFVESKVGVGTTFTVQIPFEISADTEDVEKENCICESKVAYDFSGKRILLVEDHQLNIMVAKKILEYKNALVDVAENGEKGLAMFAAAPEHTYHAVLMDIRMPVMDGLQAARGIRNLDNLWAKTVPIIAMSANAFDDDVVKSKGAGMNAHLAKPIDAALLYKTLYEFLSK